MVEERPDAPLKRLCHRVAERLRRDCLIRTALQLRGHGVGSVMSELWGAASDDDRKRIADDLAHMIDDTLVQTAIFVDYELMHDRLQATVEPRGKAYEIRGDEWLWRLLEIELFDPDRDDAPTDSQLPAGTQLYRLATAAAPVYGRPFDPHNL